MRHSISVGGRFLPPPKYMSYSILSWRMSRSNCASSSSMVATEWIASNPHPRGVAGWASTEKSDGRTDWTPRRGPNPCTDDQRETGGPDAQLQERVRCDEMTP